MNHCPLTTSTVEEALTAGNTKDLLGSAHVMSCTDCTRSLARVASFETSLQRVARSLSAGPVTEIEVAAGGTLPHRERGWLPLFSLAAVVVMLAVLVVADPSAGWLRERAPAIEPGGDHPTALAPASAARVLGVDPDELLMTEDGALAVIQGDARLSLVLARQTGAKLELLTLGVGDLGASSPSEPSAHRTFTVVCPSALGLLRSHYFFGHSAGLAPFPKVSLFGLQAEGMTTRDGSYLFAVDPGPVDPEAHWQVTTEAGGNLGTGRFLDGLPTTGRVTPAGCRIHE